MISNFLKQCVAFVRAVSNAGHTSNCIKGDNVSKLSNTDASTLIATFNSQGNYKGHVAIFLGKTDGRPVLLDQNFNGTASSPIGEIALRQIPWSQQGVPQLSGNNYFFVEQ